MCIALLDFHSEFFQCVLAADVDSNELEQFDEMVEFGEVVLEVVGKLDVVVDSDERVVEFAEEDHPECP